MNASENWKEDILKEIAGIIITARKHDVKIIVILRKYEKGGMYHFSKSENMSPAERVGIIEHERLMARCDAIGERNRNIKKNKKKGDNS